MLHIIKRYKLDGELSSIFVQDESGKPFAFFMDEPQLENFLEKTGVVLGESTEGFTKHGYKEVNYKTNKDVMINFVGIPPNLSIPHYTMRGLQGLYEVDMYLTVEDNLLCLIKPDPSNLQRFNPKETTHVDFVVKYGSIMFVDEELKEVE
ncbi:hypothetical protein ACQUY5_16760 [Bacillus cereus]|uniref:hypothetical protein n=1 Tax=Bacillus cereus TaxID=1396 RepID=UPI003D17234F